MIFFILHLLNKYSALVQSVFTLVLVLVTIYYAWQTRQTVKEAENSRKDTRLPIIRVGIRGPIDLGRSTEYILLHAENIGYGLARNIEVKFPTKETFNINNLDIKEETHSQIKLTPGDEVIINDLPEDQKVITVQYDDIFGRKITTEADFAHNHRGSWIEFDVINWKPILPK